MEQKTKHWKYSFVTKIYKISCCPTLFLLLQRKIKSSQSIIWERRYCWNSYELWFWSIYAPYSSWPPHPHLPQFSLIRIRSHPNLTCKDRIKYIPSGRVKPMVPMCIHSISFSPWLHQHHWVRGLGFGCPVISAYHKRLFPQKCFHNYCR